MPRTPSPRSTSASPTGPAGYGLFALGSYFQMTDELSNPLPDRDVDSRGYNLQVGYMIVPKTFEIAVRYALVEPDRDVDDAEVDELRLGFNYFFAGHNLKLQADVGTVGYGSNYLALPLVARRGLPPLGTRVGVSSSDPSTWQSFTDKVARLQFQLAF
ncbi:MAG: Phosphate-selective porin [Acidobacteria bacterium]|nr:Phosphate-selective porin [Acidobacteriota bacterium]